MNLGKASYPYKNLGANQGLQASKQIDDPNRQQPSGGQGSAGNGGSYGYSTSNTYNAQLAAEQARQAQRAS
jgi:hypothetical protein